MARTIPIDVDERTRVEHVTLPEMRRSIPGRYLRPNALRAWWALLRVLGSLAICFYALSRIHLEPGIGLVWEIPAMVLVWILCGWALVGLFVIGHDCGHQSFSTKPWVNTVVGHLCMAPTANSFHSWKLTHNQHHAYTLLRGQEVDWASHLLTREEFESNSRKPGWITRAGYAMPFGIALWIAWNMLRRAISIQEVLPPDVYAREKSRLLRSSAIMTAVLVAIYGGLWYGFGFWGMLKLYSIPAAIAMVTGSVIITIQHANEHSVLYDRKDWTPFRGQIVSTFDVRFPAWMEYLWFDINIHIPHHVAPSIPWYYLKQTSRLLRRAYPAYHQEQAFGLDHLAWWRRTPFLKKIPDKGYYVLEPRRWTQRQSYWLSRAVISAVVVASIGTLFFEPSGGVAYAIDILFRTYALFLGTVMAHEAVHGNLGRARATNLWWGRIALLPAMVPLTSFHKTHLLHHAFTNIPEKDPDYFVRPRNILEVPLRAMAMPHHWLLWLWKRGHIDRAYIKDLLLNYAGIFAAYALVLHFVSPWRLVSGMVPALMLVSILLWYPFAAKTHEGFSTGSWESRSHNYYGRFMYWFSLGLSMHRVHHSKPHLSWIELRNFVEEREDHGFWRRLIPGRDIRLDGVKS